MKYIVTINENSYEVEVEKGDARLIKSNETAAVPVVAKTVAAAAVEAAKPEASLAPVSAANGEKITAPMPGTILQCKKISGEPVKKGEILFILEAMKMENEIFAPRDGVIVEITTAKGAAVNTGDLLAVMQ